MAVIIQEVTAEVPEAGPRPAQPQDPQAASSGQNLTLERLRAALLRDAQRQARLWAD
jgi:hypothetical protein